MDLRAILSLQTCLMSPLHIAATFPLEPVLWSEDPYFSPPQATASVFLPVRTFWPPRDLSFFLVAAGMRRAQEL